MYIYAFRYVECLKRDSQTRSKLGNALDELAYNFNTYEDLLQFFKKHFDVTYGRASLFRWLDKGVPDVEHRPCAIPELAERNLMEVRIDYDFTYINMCAW